MEHDQAQALFSEYLDEELGAKEREALEAHLSSCAPCRAEYESFKQAVRSVSSGLLPLPPPPEFASKVERRIHRRSRGRFFSDEPGSRFPFEWLSFVIIVMLLAVYLIITVDKQVKPHPAAGTGTGTATGTSGIERRGGPS